MSHLLQAFFTGFGISAAVSIFIVPFSSRSLIFMFVTEELRGLKAVLEVHGQYMLSFPARDWYGTKNPSSGNGSDGRFSTRSRPWPEADGLKKAIANVIELQVRIQSELRYAKREVAWGKLGARDIVTICQLLKNILVPVLGMESITEVTDRIENRGGWGALRIPNAADSVTELDLDSLEENEKGQWKEMLEKLVDPTEQLQRAIIDGLDHSLYTLEFAKRPASRFKADLEANGPDCSPGERGSAKRLETGIQDFLGRCEEILNEWCAEKGMDTPQLKSMKPTDYPLHERHQSQLYLILDVSYHLY